MLTSFKKLLLIFYLVTTGTIFPQEILSSVSGFVSDSISGVALGGTNILVYKDKPDFSTNPYYSTSANNYGFYILPKLIRSKYYVIFRYIGYKTLVKEITIYGDNTNIQQNITLIPENIQLKEVVVEGKKIEKDVLSTIDVSPELLSKLPSFSGEIDLFRMLQLLPGVSTASDFSNGLYVRGGSPDQNLTLVDGAIVYNPAHLGNIASTFNSNAIRDVKLIKSAFPAEYGGRLSSVLDIKLKSGTKEKETQTLGLGVINSFFAFEGPIKESATYMFAGRWMYYDALQRSFNKNSTVPLYNFYDVNGKINYNISGTSSFSASAIYSTDRLYSPTSEDIAYDIEWKNLDVTLNWIQINTNSLFLNSSLSYINYNFSSKIGIGATSTGSISYYSNPDITDLIIKQAAEINWAMNQKFKTGAEVSFHNYDLIYNEYYDIAYEQNPYIGQNLNSIEAALFFQNESEFFNSLSTNIGGRISYFLERNFLSFEPRVSLSYELFNNFYVKGAAAIASQYIHLISRNDITLPTDLWYPTTKKIEPSKSTQYVFGLDKYLADDLYQVSVEGYYKDMRNLYEFKNSPEINPLNNSIEDQFVKGKGEAYGIEFFAQRRKGDFKGWIGYTLAWTKRKFDDLNYGKVFYPKYDRRHDLSVAATYDLTRQLSFGATFTYSTGLRFSEPPGQFLFDPIGVGGSPKIMLNYGDVNTSQFPPYHKLDLSCNYNFKIGSISAAVYANLYNVYNRKNVFAQYIVTTKDEQGSDKIVVKRISLFPFIPMAGFSLTF